MQLLSVFYIICYVLALGCVLVMVTDQMEFMSNGDNERLALKYYLQNVRLTVDGEEKTFTYGSKESSTLVGISSDAAALYGLALGSLLCWVIVIPVYLLREKYSKTEYVILGGLSISEILLLSVIGIEIRMKMDIDNLFSSHILTYSSVFGQILFVEIGGIILMIGTSVLFYFGEVRGMGN